MTASAPGEQNATRCSFTARDRGDPMVGSAAPGLGVLLVEQPGPWGRLALVSSQLDRQVGAELSRRAVHRGLRVLLVRRPGRARPRSRRRWALADCRPGHETTWWGDFGDDADLLQLPLDGSAGEQSAASTYLVCTHGRHDACCAIRGRPVAAALAAARPDQVWECSHVGGDRFATNLVALPHGLYYGRVEDTDTAAVAAAQESGKVHLPLLRGRMSSSPVAQAAEHHARNELGIDDIDALHPLSTKVVSTGLYEVVLGHRPRDLLVSVEPSATPEPALLTCHAHGEAHPPYLRVTGMSEV